MPVYLRIFQAKIFDITKLNPFFGEKMLDIAFLHTHRLMVLFYLSLLMILTTLAIFKKTALLEKWRGKIKIAHMSLGGGLLLTGLYLALRVPEPLQIPLLVKYILFVIAIPLAVVGSRRKNVWLGLVSFMLLALMAGIAITDSLSLRTKETQLTKLRTQSIAATPGEDVYIVFCANCHGPNGDADYQGALRLSASRLPDPDLLKIIKDGRGMMPGLGNHIVEADIAAVAEYVKGLRK